MPIYSSDTTWTKNSVITLSEDVQVEYEKTLTIEEGVVVNGNGFVIQVYGTLAADGLASYSTQFNDTAFKFGSNHQTPGIINLTNVKLNGGSFLAPTGNGSYGSFSVTDSFFDSVTGFYIWYPAEESSFTKNIFLDSAGLSIGTRVDVTIENNLFIGNVGPAVENWAAYDSASVKVFRNSFLSSDYYALALREGYSSSAIDATDNYFGTVVDSEIQELVFDRLDTLGNNSVINGSFLASPHPDTPAFDNEPPKIAITSSSDSLGGDEIAIITFTFSEAVKNFEIGDILITNGGLDSFSGDGAVYTARLVPEANTQLTITISVDSGKFSDSSGNFNNDGSDENNKIAINIDNVQPATYTSLILVDAGVVSDDPLWIKNAVEGITIINNVEIEHTVTVGGQTYQYSEIEALISVVTRDNQFTEEFQYEIRDLVPNFSSVTYEEVAILVGTKNIDSVLLHIAGSDGNYVG
jgi:hypothetical protein